MEVEVARSFVWQFGEGAPWRADASPPGRRTHWAFLEAIHIPVTYKV